MEGHKCDRTRRGMDDCAAVVAEHGVILVFSGERKALLAALAQAVMVARAEIPAARPLQQIAAQGRHLAELRAGSLAHRFGERRVAHPYQRMISDRGERHERADRDAAIGCWYADKHGAQRCGASADRQHYLPDYGGETV